MEAVKANRTPINFFSNRFFYFFAAFIIFAALGLVAYNAFGTLQTGFLPPKTVVISQSAFESKYGLQISLIAVTASGGMVDIRLKILDGEKAKSFLQNPKNFPALFINGVILNVSDVTKAQEINFKNNSNLYILFPNTQNLVKADAPVTLLFGATALEPIIVK